jgi:hypothetical protein
VTGDRRVLWLLAAAGLSACGGGGPSGQALPPVNQATIRTGTVLSVVSGETYRPVSGARLMVAGRPYVTDAAGEMTLGEDLPQNALLDIVADGFFDRQTLLRAESEPRYTLWPRTSAAVGLDEHLTAELWYTAGTECCPAAPEALGKRGLRRFRLGSTVTLVVDDRPELMDERVTRSLQRAADLTNTANDGRVVFQVGAASATRPRIRVTIDSETCGLTGIACMTVTRDAQGYIDGGTLTLDDDPARIRFGVAGPVEDRLTGLFAHELGHALGLGHSSRPGVMSVLNGRGTNITYFARNPDFTPVEKLLLRLAVDRRPNTVFPDDDRHGPVTLAAVGEEVVCRF